MGAILGKATIKVDGKTLLNKHGAELDIGGDELTPETGPNGVHGSSATVTPPMLTVTLSKDTKTKLKDLDAIRDATITFNGDDGSSFVLSNGFRTKPPKLSESKGAIQMEFSAMRCDEL